VWGRLRADTIEISAGTLDRPTGLPAIGHIFAESKPDYYALPDDGLPKCAEDDDDGLFAF